MKHPVILIIGGALLAYGLYQQFAVTPSPVQFNLGAIIGGILVVIALFV
jgi:hypothetical protein